MGDRKFVSVLLERVLQSSERELILLLELSERRIKLVITATLEALQQVVQSVPVEADLNLLVSQKKLPDITTKASGRTGANKTGAGSNDELNEAALLLDLLHKCLGRHHQWLAKQVKG
jgi:hypothetical protein